MLENPQTEIVEGLTCCVWRDATFEPPRPKGEFGAMFLVLIGVTAVAILALAKVVLWAIETGHDTLAKVLGMSLAFTPQLLMLAMVYARKARRQKQDPSILPPPPPEGIPSDAVPMVAVIRAGNHSRGRSFGWFWVDGPWIQFRGDRFDFRLHPSNFRSRKYLKKMLRTGGPYNLKVPRFGLATQLGLYPRFYIGSEGYIPKAAIENMEYRVEEWAESLDIDEPALYPPLASRPVAPSPRSLIPARKWLPIALATGAVMTIVTSTLPTARQNNPFVVFLAGAGMIATVFLSPWVEKWLRTLQSKKKGTPSQ